MTACIEVSEYFSCQYRERKIVNRNTKQSPKMVLYILVYFRLGAILIFHLQITILIICEQRLLLKM